MYLARYNNFRHSLKYSEIIVIYLSAVFALLYVLPTYGTAAEEEGICTRVRIQLSQDVVIARNAFKANLEITNAPENVPLESFYVILDITDENDQPANNLFGINPPELSGVGDVNGAGIIQPGTSAVASWLIVPTRDAAPDMPLTYYVGGELGYTQGESIITIPLFPVPILVKPDPLLLLDYFWVRDVYGDDPFTPEIEPAEPFPLGLMVRNNGKGVANNFRIVSSQPEIIENEKGLLVDFKIIGAQVNSDPFSPSLSLNLGNIDPGTTSVALWTMTSSLQGKFIDYDATFAHLDGLGNARLSLIDTVNIHELTHAVRVDIPGDDNKPDFLVNDVPDDDHLPDTLYDSVGSIQPVSVGQNASVNWDIADGRLEAYLALSAPTGWVYIRANDPGQDYYRLKGVVRSDGRAILVDHNAWTTHRTVRLLGQEPYREHLLHLFDKDSTGFYRLIYEILDSDGDGMPSSWETAHGLNPDDPSDASLDSDEDDLTNKQEFEEGTEPFNFDTDGDGYGDGEEVNAGSDPLDKDSIPNRPPVADAGPDQNVITESPVTLNGKASYDPEGEMITFLWTFIEVPEGSIVSDNSLTDMTGAKPEFTPDLNGQYTLQLIVNDGLLNSAPDVVMIRAATSNVAPNANAGPDRNVLTNSTVWLDAGRSTDPDNGPEPLSILWSFGLAPGDSLLTDGDISDRDHSEANFVPDVDGIYVVEVTVSDGDLESEDTVEILAATTDVPPNADAGSDLTIHIGETAFLDGSVSYDPDEGPEPLAYLWQFVGLPLTSSLSQVGIQDADTAYPSFTPDVLGTFIVQLAVDDGQYQEFDNTAVTVVPPPDSDNDGVADNVDNCPETPNREQVDSDDDGIGDACEPIGDLNNDNCTDRADYSILMEAIREGVSNNPSYDLNGDGQVNRADARTLVGAFTNYRGAPCP